MAIVKLTGASDDSVNGFQLGNFVVATERYTAANVQTGGAGWYRLAKLRLATVGSTQFVHCAGLIFLGGFYNAYKPTKGVFSFAYDGGTNNGNIVQLGGTLGTSPTQLRITSTAASAADGSGFVMVDLYFTNTGTMTGNEISVEVCGAKGLILQAPELVDAAPTGETVRATLSIGTISTGRVTTTT